MDLNFNKQPKIETQKLNEIVAKFGDSLTIFNHDNPTIREHTKDLGLLPDGLIRGMKEKGVKIVLGEGNFIDVLEKTPGIKYSLLELATKIAFSREELADSIGGYNSITKTLFLTDGVAPVTSTVLHEYGHAVGHICKLDESPLMKQIHEDLFAKLDDNIQQGGPGSRVGSRELVAESFADYFKLKKEVYIKKYNESLYSHMQSFIINEDLKNK